MQRYGLCRNRNSKRFAQDQEGLHGVGPGNFSGPIHREQSHLRHPPMPVFDLAELYALNFII